MECKKYLVVSSEYSTTLEDYMDLVGSDSEQGTLYDSLDQAETYAESKRKQNKEHGVSYKITVLSVTIKFEEV